MSTNGAEEGSKGPTCRCGHGIGHHMVSAEPEYSFGAWFAVLVGISVTPRKLKYRCRRCEQVFHETSDRSLLAAHD